MLQIESSPRAGKRRRCLGGQDFLDAVAGIGTVGLMTSNLPRRGFEDEPDYETCWPANSFEIEISNACASSKWRDRIQVVLEAAFPSRVPANDFLEVADAPARWEYTDADSLVKSEAIAWVTSLVDAYDRLPVSGKGSPYWSQRKSGGQPLRDLPATAELIAKEIRAFHEQKQLFAGTLGYWCIDDPNTDFVEPRDYLNTQVGKGYLWEQDPRSWSEDDLCDFIEVFHDASSFPRTLYHHDFDGCYHPSNYSNSTGRRLYRWWINATLSKSTLGLEISEEGTSAGRIVRTLPPGLDDLVSWGARAEAEEVPVNEVQHAVEQFRKRDATREDKRSATITLARILEQNRGLLKAELLTGDEGALFQIANQFDIRHSKEDERRDYGEHFLDWIFFWYLGSVKLVDTILSQRQD